MSVENGSIASNGYVDINQLRSEHPVSVEQMFRYYGLPLPPMATNSRETRMACPFPHCGKQAPTGAKAISIQQDTRGFLWRCFHYGCSHGGNDVSFADLLRDTAGDGKPRRDRFKQIVADYVEMAGGVEQRASIRPTPTSSEASVCRVNIPLAESDNEKARGLIHLPQKFVTDLASMPPAAASYVRNRPHWFHDPEKVLAEWNVGYLPMDAGEDRSGGTMRGKFVFPICSETGEILAFTGRDPMFEEKHARWLSLPEAKRAEEPEPMKWRFPKNFHRGLELWGQERISSRGVKKRLKAQGGLLIVEGPGDVIRLSQAGLLAVGLMSNQATNDQVVKIAQFAWGYADGKVQLMLDLDDEGRKGMGKLLQSLSPEAYVRVVWTSQTNEGRFQGKQPEELTSEELVGVFSRRASL